MFLFIDTETTGLPKGNKFQKKYIFNWPRLIQISWLMYNSNGELISNKTYYIKLKNYKILTLESQNVHHITKKKLKLSGENIQIVLDRFYNIIKRAEILVGFNLNFDINILIGEYLRYNKKEAIDKLNKIIKIDIQKKVLYNYNKFLSLKNLYFLLYKKNNKNLHNSYYDVNVTALCFFKLIYYKAFTFNFKLNLLNFYSNIPLINKGRNNNFYYKKNIKNKKFNIAKWFFNIHNHTCYNILSSTINIKDLINRAIKYKMKAIGICDNNMLGAFKFIDSINKNNLNQKEKFKIKGILGYNIFIRDKKNNFYNHTLVVKNTTGYYNLIKISSYSHLNNLYVFDKNNYINYIEKKIVKKYNRGLIFLTGNLNSEISYYIRKNNIKKAESILLYWKNIFNNNIYIELFINDIKYEDKINSVLLKFSKKHNIPYIIQYDAYYLKKSDYLYYDILFKIKNKITFYQDISSKKRKYINKLPNNKFYFKKYSELKDKYKKLKNGFYNLKLLYKQIDNINFIKKDFLPDKFTIPKKFLAKNKNKKNINYLYLKHLTYSGAKKKYKKLNKKILLRIKKELKLIKDKNFTNYFLIVRDIINIAKKNKIDVGPGRGSVAGSIISYSLDITKMDPLKYKLLFERFLNIYRKKLPDIDLDFNYKTRLVLIEKLIKKYKKDYVSYIITYGKMGTKTAIRDCGRVFNLPLSNINYITSLLDKNNNIDNLIYRLKNKLFYNEKYKKYLNKIDNFDLTLDSFILNISKKLIGIIRNIGIHACGFIISKERLKDNIPLISLYNKNIQRDVVVTQYDSKAIEKLGLLKIDLLGLRTLAVIRESLDQIKNNKKKFKLDLKDKSTYRLFHNNKTSGIFQYESKGIKIIASSFKAKKFEELVDFNALYRPGPLQYLPIYIERKNNKTKVKYDLPVMKKYLKDTYGVTIYQEQVLLLAKIISGMNEYEADILREAIAKKNSLKLKKLKKQFITKSLKRGYDIKILNKIWKDWEYFASYAFNKSHATCYAYLSFKTAFLKQNYNIEFWSSIFNNYLENRDKLEYLLNEAKNMGVNLLNPDINKSRANFYIENKTSIRYGLSGIKGLGKKSTQIILDTRNSKKFISIFDFLYRNNLTTINKRLVKILILTGCFNSFGINKYKYFIIDKRYNIPKIEVLIRKISEYKEKKPLKYIINKYKNYFDLDPNIDKTYKNDYYIIKYYRKEVKYLGVNLIKDLYYKKTFIFDIYSLTKYNIHQFNKVMLLSCFIKEIYKYKNIYNLEVFYYNNYKEEINIKLNISNNKVDIIKNAIKKQIYKNNLVVLKVYNNKILDIKILKKLLKRIRTIYIKIYNKFYSNKDNETINKILEILNNSNINDNAPIINIYFKVYDKNKNLVYKEINANIKITTNILYKIKKKFPKLYIKI